MVYRPMNVHTWRRFIMERCNSAVYETSIKSERDSKIGAHENGECKWRARCGAWWRCQSSIIGLARIERIEAGVGIGVGVGVGVGATFFILIRVSIQRREDTPKD
uniref:Uncharacterized protein n=1 Tax=Vespula pensylvanica TaxID=30213 RepID=A0A834KCT0_VESPE|nr:hypothetical protein H0235_015027 [Vespula pensylvanica]